MHMVLSVEQGKVWACLTESQTEPRERLHSGKPQTFVQSTSQTRKVMPGVSQKKKKKKRLFRFSALRYLWPIFFFFIWSDQIKKVRSLSEIGSFSHLYPMPSQQLREWIMCPLWRWPIICCPASLKERKENYVFATDLAIWNSSHHPFLGLKLLSLEVPSHCALYQLVLEKSWIAYVQNFLNFILFWNFASLGLEHTGHPTWPRALFAGCGLAVCWSLKVPFPPQYPLFGEVSMRSVRCASCSLLA